jgi:hypothetical protein
VDGEAILVGERISDDPAKAQIRAPEVTACEDGAIVQPARSVHLRRASVPGVRREPRARTVVSALLVWTTSLVAIASPARATNPEVILDRPRAGEYQPVRGEGRLAWQQNSMRRPRHYDVLVRDVDGGPTTRVNPAGTNGANGDIAGNILVYQQFEERRSGVRFFDLTTGERSHPPNGVNTERWEYWPSVSGRWLLFGRLARGSGARRVILFDLSTGDGKTLAKVRGRHTFLAPGQVTGDWAVWSRCAARSPCTVVRYQISTADRHVIGDPNGQDHHSPSVDAQGTVFYARGGDRCGNRVRLIRQPLEGGEDVLWRLPNGDDIGRTHVQVRSRGRTILYDHFSCGRPVESDAWQFVV